MSEFLKTMSDAEVQAMKEHFYTLGWGQNETMWKCWNRALDYMAGKQLAEANKKLAEAQARIKVLEDALVNAIIPLRGIDMRDHSELAKAAVLNAIRKIDAALFTTSPTEALDKVVREGEPC